MPAEVAGPGGIIPFPKRVTYFDYEGEVAIVIGKRELRAEEEETTPQFILDRAETEEKVKEALSA